MLVIVSGMCCFALQENWHKSLSMHEKVMPYRAAIETAVSKLAAHTDNCMREVPIYFLLGTTLSFSIIFGMGDIVNICGTR